jgi:gamma-glutamylcyclotransferase (GGCT)/AIG2-like uncharacterized protein YtfP
VEKLFSYGTLQQHNVQISTFGRLLEGESDLLIGYIVAEITITDAAVIAASGKHIHPILQFTGNPQDEVAGTLFALSASELAQADSYEVKEYVRVRATLKSGMLAWIYAAAQ